MAQLRQDYAEFIKRDTEILVIGPEPAGIFKVYFLENSLPFTGLPDPAHSVLKLYGQEIKLFKFGRMPAQALLDKNGVVRFIHYGHEMNDIPSNAEMLDLIDSIQTGDKE